MGWRIICVIVSCIADAPCNALLARATRRLPECTHRCTANAADIAPLWHAPRLLVVTGVDLVSTNSEKTLNAPYHTFNSHLLVFVRSLAAAHKYRRTHTQRCSAPSAEE